jgi:hypothetical protein
VTKQSSKLRRWLRDSALIVAIGLMVELISLVASHPAAFLLFLWIDALLITASILFYFYSLVALSAGPTQTQRKSGGMR